MNNSMEILKRDSLNEGGFAGLKEHRLVKAPEVFGPHENNDGSWPGLANFVYLADAMPALCHTAKLVCTAIMR